MSPFPQEIVDHIVSFLPQIPRTKVFESSSERKARKFFPRCAAVSRQFQLAVEPRTFRSLTISNDKYELQKFRAIVDSRRFSYILELRYSIALPRGKQVIYWAFEQLDEQAVNNKTFTLAMKHLFQVLKPQGKTAKGMILCINNIDSPSDAFLKNSLSYRRHQRSRIRLLMKPEDLPLLPSVSRLVLSPTVHLLQPRMLIDIASRLPELTAIDLTFDAREFIYLGLPVSDRKLLADAIREHSEALKQVREVRLIMDADGGPINQLINLPPCFCTLGYDPLGSALRRWSRGLEFLNLQGSFDRTLFWPDIREAEWYRYHLELKHSKLKYLYVKLERYTPSGWWYFMPTSSSDYGYPVEDDDQSLFPPLHSQSMDEVLLNVDIWWGTDPKYIPRDHRYLRTVPHDETIEPLVESWARTLRWMPAIEVAALSFADQNTGESGQTPYGDDNWMILYRAPLARDCQWDPMLSEAAKKSRCLWFRNVGDWMPRSSTIELLLDAGKRAHEDTPMVVLRDSEIITDTFHEHA
ncbi:hypothetical protein F4809DRAFT_596709 [Biscogniauxia mediterranea]|nr:hypothetical protein F4809DRAFT_596709 [Biscogniauxia mediterranea]